MQLLSPDLSDYQLIDSGHGRKLERFGRHTLIRPEPKAWWRPDTGDEQWGRALAEFGENGKWNMLQRGASRQWEFGCGDGLTFELRLTDNSKHVGLFPEQDPHWRWIRHQLESTSGKGDTPRLLNLFGYTGAATLVAAAAGAQVTHVDASKPALSWARRNQELSGLADKPVRWLLDDAFKFVAREIRRGSQYDGILLDPPSFGRGPRGEVWKVEQQIVDLLMNLRKLLSPDARFLVLTMYNLEASSYMLHNLMTDVFGGGRVESGELGIAHRHSGKILPLSLFSRWQPE